MRHKLMNPSDEFLTLLRQLLPFTESIEVLLHNQEKLFELLDAALSLDNYLQKKNQKALQSTLEIALSALKDLRNMKSFYFFTTKLIRRFYAFLQLEDNNEIYEEVFNFITFFVKFFFSEIQGNFKEFIKEYKLLLTGNRRFIRKFAIQSVAHVLVNADQSVFLALREEMTEWNKEWRVETVFSGPTRRSLVEGVENAVELVSDLFFEMLAGPEKSMAIRASDTVDRMKILLRTEKGTVSVFTSAFLKVIVHFLKRLRREEHHKPIGLFISIYSDEPLSTRTNRLPVNLTNLPVPDELFAYLIIGYLSLPKGKLNIVLIDTLLCHIRSNPPNLPFHLNEIEILAHLREQTETPKITLNDESLDHFLSVMKAIKQNRLTEVGIHPAYYPDTQNDISTCLSFGLACLIQQDMFHSAFVLLKSAECSIVLPQISLLAKVESYLNSMKMDTIERLEEFALFQSIVQKRSIQFNLFLSSCLGLVANKPEQDLFQRTFYSSFSINGVKYTHLADYISKLILPLVLLATEEEKATVSNVLQKHCPSKETLSLVKQPSLSQAMFGLLTEESRLTALEHLASSDSFYSGFLEIFKTATTPKEIAVRVEMEMAKQIVSNPEESQLRGLLFLLLGCLWKRPVSAIQPAVFNSVKQILKVASEKHEMLSLFFSLVEFLNYSHSAETFLLHNGDTVKSLYFRQNIQEKDNFDMSLSTFLDAALTALTPVGMLMQEENLNVYFSLASRLNQTVALKSLSSFRGDNYQMNLLSNYVYSCAIKGENKALAHLVSAFTYCTLDLKSKPELSSFFLDFMVNSRSVELQKQCVSVIFKFYPSLRMFSKLIEETVDAPVVTQRLYNLAEVTADSKEPVSEEDRRLLSELLTHIYFAKFFPAFSKKENKKNKTSNLPNLLNFFAQLEVEQFETYFRLILSMFPQNSLDFEGKRVDFTLLDLNKLYKLIEILKVNIREKLNFLARKDKEILFILGKLLEFLKRIGDKEKLAGHQENSEFKGILNKIGLEREFDSYLATYKKLVKVSKKEIFGLLTVLVKDEKVDEESVVSTGLDILHLYEENLVNMVNTDQVKITTFLGFFFSFAVNRHSLYYKAPRAVKAAIGILKNKGITPNDTATVLEFCINLVEPYSEANNHQFTDNFFEDIVEGTLSLVNNEIFSFSTKGKLTYTVLYLLDRLFCSHHQGITVAAKQPLLEIVLSLESTALFTEECADTLSLVLRLTIRLSELCGFPVETYRTVVEFLPKVPLMEERELISVLLNRYVICHGTEDEKKSVELVLRLNKRGEQEAIGNLNFNNLTDCSESISVLAKQISSVAAYQLLIYQLVFYLKNKDFSVQSIALNKSKEVVQQLVKKTGVESFLREPVSEGDKVLSCILSQYHSLIRLSDQTVSKSALEIFAEINKHLACSTPISSIFSDLYNLKLNDSSVLECILSSHFPSRKESFALLTEKVQDLSQFSIKTVIVPVVKNSLSPLSYRDSAYVNEESVYSLAQSVQHFLDEFSTVCDCSVFLDLLKYFNFESKRIRRADIQFDFKAVNMIYNAMATMLLKHPLLSNYEYTTLFEQSIATKLEKIKQNTPFDYSDSNLTDQQIAKKVRSMMFLSKNHSSTLMHHFASSTKEIEVNYKQIASNLPEDKANCLSFIKKVLYPSLKSELVDSKKKQGKTTYSLRNNVLPSLMAALKLLSPSDIKFQIGSLTYEFVNNLKLKDFAQRQRALAGLTEMISKHSSYFAVSVIETLKSTLDTGPFRFVMTYTVNELLRTVQNKPYLFDFAVPTLMPILIEDIFGSISVDREQDFAKKTPESKKSKSMDAFVLLGREIDYRSSILTVINSLREFAERPSTSKSAFTKVKQLTINLIAGLKNNPTTNPDDLTLTAFPLLLSLVERIEEKNKNEENTKNTLSKGSTTVLSKENNSFKSQMDSQFTVQMAAAQGKKYHQEAVKQASAASNSLLAADIFGQFGVQLVSLSLDTEIPTNTKVIINLIPKLLHSEHSFIVVKALKVFLKAIDFKLIEAKTNLNRVKSFIFRHFRAANKDNLELTQTVLKCLTQIMLKYPFVKLENEKIKLVIDYLTVNLEEKEVKLYVLACLVALLKKGYLHPSIYEIMEQLQTNCFEMREKNQIELVQQAFLVFLEKYPSEKKMKTVNHFVANFESENTQVVLVALGMVQFVYSSLDRETKEKYEDFVLLKICSICCCSDKNVKTRCAALFETVFDSLSEKKKTFFLDYFMECLSNKKGEDYLKMSLTIMNIVCAQQRSEISHRLVEIVKSIVLVMENDLIETEKLLEGLKESSLQADKRKFRKQDLFSERSEDLKTIKTLKVEIRQFDCLWLSLELFEKLTLNYNILLTSDYDPNLVDKVVKAAQHPNNIVKLKALQVFELISEGFTRYSEKIKTQIRGFYPEFAGYLGSLMVGQDSDLAEKALLVLEYCTRMVVESVEHTLLDLVSEFYVQGKSCMRTKAKQDILARILQFYQRIAGITVKYSEIQTEMLMLATKAKRDCNFALIQEETDAVLP